MAGFEVIPEVDSLAELPERCALAPEATLREKGVRQLLYGEGHGVYRILYRSKARACKSSPSAMPAGNRSNGDSHAANPLPVVRSRYGISSF